MTSRPLKRILGAPTALLIGMGVAIGSGIFRTPGDVASSFPDWRLLILAWIVGGLIVLVQGMVTAELATRFPKAGGEYVYLREAYGDFPAFFFGWAYTIFIVGGGAATIAAAFGDFACDLLAADPSRSGMIGAGAIILVTLLNTAGLRAGAGVQNVLTFLKVVALLGIAVIGFVYGSGPTETASTSTAEAPVGTWTVMLAGVLPILWTYNGTTDIGKMAEEIKDVRRTLPLALIGSSLVMILVYVVFNFAMLRLVSMQDMAGEPFVPGLAVEQLFGTTGRNVMLVVAMLVCLGSLSSTLLATIRVTFALARDGLTFRFMSKMSRNQAPVPAFVVVAVFSVILVLNRSFSAVLDIYFLASAVLFGLTYASLIVFRLRDPSRSETVFHCPWGMALSVFLILFQIVLAINIVRGSPSDAGLTGLMLLAIGMLYFFWKRIYLRNPEEPQ